MYSLTACLCGAIFLNCSPKTGQATSTQDYTVRVLKRRNLTAEPLVAGTVEEIGPSSSPRALPLTYIILDGQLTKSSPDGTYAFRLQPGKHNLAVKWLGLRSVYVHRLQVKPGDSIRLDFHLRADSTML